MEKKNSIIIREFEAFEDGIKIKWAKSGIGFGEYTIYKDEDTGKWVADSECMDSNKKKDFLKELVNILIEDVSVIC